LLPPEGREPVRKQWTQGIGAIGLLMVPFAAQDQPTQVRLSDPLPPNDLPSNDLPPKDLSPKDGSKMLLAELIGQISAHLGPRISGLPDALNPLIKPSPQAGGPMASFDDWDTAISTLTAVKGLPFVPHLPSVVVLRVTHGEQQRVYSVIANRAFKSQFTLVFQDGARLPEDDTMSVYPTLVNGFPNLFVDLDLADAAGFLADLQTVRSQDDWQRFAARYGILRNSARFWAFYDWLNAWNFSNRGDAAGWLDLTYYDAAETEI
jgi:hypothetical protein